MNHRARRVALSLGLALLLVACQGTEWGERLERAVAPGTPQREERPFEPTPTPTVVATAPTVAPTPNPTPSPTGSPSQVPTGNDFTDLDDHPYAAAAMRDLQALGVFRGQAGDRFYPDRSIRRSEFARWVVLANNALYANDPTHQIRLARPTETPIFLDVPEDHPDFPYIQALGNAGFVDGGPDREFDPDHLLSRADAIDLKTQIDLAPTNLAGSRELIRDTWGFTDSAEIPDRAIPAVVADYNLGPDSNIRRVFGLLRALNPQTPVTRAEAAIALAEFGPSGDRRTAAIAAGSPPTVPRVSPSPEVSPTPEGSPIPEGSPTPEGSPIPEVSPTPEGSPTVLPAIPAPVD